MLTAFVEIKISTRGLYAHGNALGLRGHPAFTSFVVPALLLSTIKCGG